MECSLQYVDCSSQGMECSLQYVDGRAEIVSFRLHVFGCTTQVVDCRSQVDPCTRYVLRPMGLGDVIGRWIGKVEVVLAGADEDLRAGQEALSTGNALEARAAAHRVLARAPGSPLGLALLADACEMGGLDAELAMTLEELSKRAPSRAEVWVRLGRARRLTGAGADEVRDAFVRALAVAEGGSEERRDALVELADLDLAAGDGARAELWLERAADDKSPAIAVRKAQARLLRGDAAGAKTLLDKVELPATDGRAALVKGSALAILDDPACFTLLVRAMVLDAPGASEALSSALGHVPSDAQVRARVRSVVDAKGEQDRARWRAAFARAEGARDAARRALRDALDAGEKAAALPLLDAAVDDRDETSLRAALAALPHSDADAYVTDARHLAMGTLDEAVQIRHPRLRAWADEVALTAARALAPAGAQADWPKLLARLDALARTLSDLESVASVASLSAERARPVRLAIVGEFNAGKSTFINALIGADVAPTGVLPTTATLHHLRWAPDPIARILFAPGHEPRERIVPLSELRATLASLDPGRLTEDVARVELHMPLPLLVRVEILDTPGFNAPDPKHTAVARSAFEEADVLLWLLDASQPLKQSERRVLEEAKAARLPVQMLVNKADRLSPDNLAIVMKTVDEALVETGLPSWAPPLALSAKKALAGKLGDAAALEQSGWAAVQALLDERIVARSDDLKERALRRRASLVVARLLAQASADADRQREQDEARARQAATVAQLAARIERGQDTLAEQLAKSLAPSAEAFTEDLSLVFVGRDPDAAKRDPVLARYRTDRAVAALAPPLSRALASLAPEAGLSPAQLAPPARTIVRAAASASLGEDDAPLLAIARAAVSTLVEQLFTLSTAPTPSSRTGAILAELKAFAGALE
jgi:GTP-binding protein EngB required for normal cell division